MTKKRRLIILSDYGLDDAVAGIYCLEHRAEFSGIDIVAVAGNSPASKSLQNAKKLLTAYGELDNVRLIDTNDIAQYYAMLESIHGVDGMGDILEAQSDYCVIKFADFIKDVEKDGIILSLGTCTVTKKILELVGERELIIMGGLVEAEPNFKGMEFNQAISPEDFSYCVKFPHKVATLDTCRHIAFNLAGKRFDSDRLLNRLINRANELAEARHADNSYIYDFICALYLFEPQIFTSEIRDDGFGNQLNMLRLADDSFRLYDYVKKLAKK